MTATYPWLDQPALEVIERTPSERLAWFQSQRVWIPYPRANALLADMQRLIERPRYHRMRGMLVISDSNNGKSRLAQECLARNPMNENPDGDHIILPVLLLEMPPRPDENDVLDSLLEMLSQPFRRKAPISDKRSQVIKVLGRCELRALLVDEVQRLLGARQEMRRVVMDALRYIANQVPVPLIVFSTPRGANALSSSDEMINRLHPEALPAWNLDSDFRMLLSSYEGLLPLREHSRLTTKATAALIHSKTEGLIGEVHDLLELAVESTFSKGSEKIDDELIRSLSWVEPSNRKRLIGVPGRVQ